MNIAFFTDSYKPYLSGVVKSIVTFKKELERQGHNVYIFAPDYPSAGRQEGVYRFVSLPTPSQKDFRLAIPISNKLISDLKRLKLDIIHTHTPFLMGGLARHAAKRLDLPLVFTFHTLYDQYVHYVPFIGGLAKRFIFKYVNDFCSSCDLIIAPSRFVEKRLRSNQINKSIITIATGLELEGYRERDFKLLDDLKKELGSVKFAVKLIYVGRLGEEKNLFFLLRVFKLIIKKYKLNACLIIVGDGPARGRLEKYCQEEGLSKRVKFTGKQRSDRVTAYYQLSDLFVFPSRTETQGLVTIEAMASGLPVVGINAAGTKYMVDHGENGFLTANDERLFADAVVRISTDSSLYNKMSSSALAKSESLSIAKMTALLLDTYHELIVEDSIGKLMG